jgi:subtilisin family serine protease
MRPLELVRLTPLMADGLGAPEVKIGLIDGPVVIDHPDLAAGRVEQIVGPMSGRCSRVDSAACRHGTFVAGILLGRRGSVAPAICPECTLLVRPVFAEAWASGSAPPTATSADLAAAICDCVAAGARLINLSLALVRPSAVGQRLLEQALDLTARRGVLVVAAAGNQGTVGGSLITRHPWVIPVAACDLRGRPSPGTNLGHTIGRQGLLAPDEGLTSLGSDGTPMTASGSSVAAPLVTGAAALVWSSKPEASPADIRAALVGAIGRRAVVPPLLDAWSARQEITGARP